MSVWWLVLLTPVVLGALVVLWAQRPAIPGAGPRVWQRLEDAGALEPNRRLSESPAQDTGPAQPRGPSQHRGPAQPREPAGTSAPVDERTRRTLRVLTHNVGFASGMANNRPVARSPEETQKNLHTLMAALATHQPDLAALQEVDGHAKRSFFVDQPRELARAANLAYGGFAENWNKRYVPFPFWPPAVHYGPILSGTALLSRYPILEQTIVRLPQPPSKSVFYRAFYLQRAIQQVRIAGPDERRITLLNLHIEPFDQQNREHHAAIVVDLVRRIRESSDDAIIVLGDCNAPPPYATKKAGFAPGTETADFTTDQTVAILTGETSLESAIPEAQYLANETAACTFPADGPVVTLDYILHSPELRPRSAEVLRGGRCGSDHLPILTTLELV